MFPNEQRAVRWFECLRWPDAKPGEDSTDRACPRCGSLGTHVVKSGKPMPYRCRDCRKYFSVRTGTAIEASNLSMRKWAYAIYLWLTSLKGVSAMKLQRDLRVSYPTAWFVAHRLRESFASQAALFSGPVEVDETYMGGKRMRFPILSCLSGLTNRRIWGLSSNGTKTLCFRVVPGQLQLLNCVSRVL